MRRVIALSALVGLCLVACQGGEDTANDRLIQAYHNGDEGVWVDGSGTVGNMYGDERLGGVEIQRFQVKVNPQFSFILQYHHAAGQRIPIQNGMPVRFAGIYQWRPTGGVVDSGLDVAQGTWVEYHEQRYQ